MSEWWRYSPSDFLLFSPRTYYRLFELHNVALWPAHLVALALGALLLVAIVRRGGARPWLAPIVLACTFAFVAWAYLWRRYATINWAATWFAGAFTLQAALLAWSAAAGWWRPGVRRDARRWPGVALVLAGLVLYPFVAPLSGRPLAQGEIFGIAPDPTVIVSLGVLVAESVRRRWLLLLVPVLWCAITGLTLWTMGSPDAWLSPLAAVVAVAVSLVLGRGDQPSAVPRRAEPRAR